MKIQAKKQAGKIGKKAVVSTTITWIFVVILILFILILFIAVSGIVSVFSEWPGYSIFKGGGVDLTAAKNLENFLNINTEVRIDGENSIISMKDFIFKSLENYLKIPDDKISKNFYPNGKTLKEDINNLQYVREYLLNRREELRLIYGYGEYDDLLLKKCREFFDILCKDYMLKLPQGIIKKDRDFFAETETSLKRYEEEFLAENWGSWNTITFSYDHPLTVKYRKPRKC